MRKLLATLTSAVLVSAVLFAADAALPRKAPELALTVPGPAQKLLSQYRGKVVALEFIWTTCPHCQAWSKTMTKFQGEYGARGFQALDVAVNDNADLLVENFIKDYHVGFPVGWATRDTMLAFMGFNSAYYVVPQLALIDRKGMIRYQTPERESEDWDKLMKEDVVRQHIEELLGPASAHSGSAERSARVALVSSRK